MIRLMQKYNVDTRHVSSMRGTNALHEARSFGRRHVVELLLKVNCLGKVDAAIRQWEFGHLRLAFEKWMKNSGVAETRGRRLNAGAPLVCARVVAARPGVVRFLPCNGVPAASQPSGFVA